MEFIRDVDVTNMFCSSSPCVPGHFSLDCLISGNMSPLLWLNPQRQMTSHLRMIWRIWTSCAKCGLDLPGTTHPCHYRLRSGILKLAEMPVALQIIGAVVCMFPQRKFSYWIMVLTCADNISSLMRFGDYCHDENCKFLDLAYETQLPNLTKWSEYYM